MNRVDAVLGKAHGGAHLCARIAAPVTTPSVTTPTPTGRSPAPPSTAARSKPGRSQATDPPSVDSGWFVAPAKLNASFELDQRGTRWAHLIRIANSIETEAGKLREEPARFCLG